MRLDAVCLIESESPARGGVNWCFGVPPRFFLEDRMQKKPRGEKLEPATYWTTAEEKAAAQKEAKRRGMTGSQLVRLAVANEIRRGGK